MNLALNLLYKRGFLKQCTSLKVLSDLMDGEKIVFMQELMQHLVLFILVI